MSGSLSGEKSPNEVTSEGGSIPPAAQSAVALSDPQANDRLYSPFARIAVLLVLLAFAIVGFAFFIRSCRQQQKVNVASSLFHIMNFSVQPPSHLRLGDEFSWQVLTTESIENTVDASESRISRRAEALPVFG